MSSTIKLALIQMDIAIGNPDRNFEKCAELLEQAVNNKVKPDIIMLPELWNTGYALEQIHDIADLNGSRTKRFISEFCRKNHVHVMAGSIAEKINEDVRNTMYAFNQEGELVSDYSKIHLFRLMDEEKHLKAGNKIGEFEIDGLHSSMMICYDIRFPELARKLALNGAKILFVPAEWPKPRVFHWRTLLLARAIENQMFVVACNRVGISGETGFFGHSMVIDPWGDVIVEGGEEEEVLHAEIDISKVDEVRRKIPIFEDRRPSLY